MPENQIKDKQEAGPDNTERKTTTAEETAAAYNAQNEGKADSEAKAQEKTEKEPEQSKRRGRPKKTSTSDSLSKLQDLEKSCEMVQKKTEQDSKGQNEPTRCLKSKKRELKSLFFRDLLDARKEMPQLVKKALAQDLSNGRCYSYMDLPSVLNTVTPILAEHNLIITNSTKTDTASNVLTVITRLYHTVTCCHMETQFSVKLPAMNSYDMRSNIQEAGSANTYLRRYNLCNLLNIIGENEDDNGDAASNKNNKINCTLPKAAEKTDNEGADTQNHNNEPQKEPINSQVPKPAEENNNDKPEPASSNPPSAPIPEPVRCINCKRIMRPKEVDECKKRDGIMLCRKCLTK